MNVLDKLSLRTVIIAEAGFLVIPWVLYAGGMFAGLPFAYIGLFALVGMFYLMPVAAGLSCAHLIYGVYKDFITYNHAKSGMTHMALIGRIIQYIILIVLTTLMVFISFNLPKL